ncbi:MAG TPA: four helix bundle protein [Sphingobacteriaceae bacterium]
MTGYKKYTDLEVWKEARKLVNAIYNATQSFPKEELFGLTNQIRRCAVSVPSNIAEGSGRNHKKDSIQFFYIGRGSLYEVETQLYLCHDLHYISEADLNLILIQLETVRKLLNGLIRYYSADSGPTTHNPQLTT